MNCTELNSERAQIGRYHCEEARLPIVVGGCFSEKLSHLEKIEEYWHLMFRGLQDGSKRVAYLRKHAIEWSYFMDCCITGYQTLY